jgi:hypothetical protein
MASVSGLDLKSELRSHEVAIAELNNLPSGRVSNITSSSHFMLLLLLFTPIQYMHKIRVRVFSNSNIMKKKTKVLVFG